MSMLPSKEWEDGYADGLKNGEHAHLIITIDLQKRITVLTDRLKAMYALVKKLEWHNEWDGAFPCAICDFCGTVKNKSKKHGTGCPLATELRATEQLLGLEDGK